MPLIDTQIRRRLSEYIAGDMTLKKFAAWFAPVVWGIGSAPAGSQDLAYELELRLAEYSNGDWTEAELRRLFRSVLMTQVIVSNPPMLSVQNQTTSSTMTATASTSSFRFVGTARATVSA